MGDFDGSWDVTLHVPQGDQQVTLMMNSEASTGTFSANGGAAADLLDLVIEGTSASWRARITEPMPLMIDFKATVDGDQLTGVATAASVIKIPFDGTRS
jgi:hypothetical protein